MTTPTDPNSSVPPPQAQETSSMSNPSLWTGSMQFQPMTFLGMQFDAEQTKQLWNSILQTMNSQIQKEKAKALKDIRNFGKDPSDPDYEQ